MGAACGCWQPLIECGLTEFSRYFGTMLQFWLNLQTAYDLSRAEMIAGSAIERDVHPRAA